MANPTSQTKSCATFTEWLCRASSLRSANMSWLVLAVSLLSSAQSTAREMDRFVVISGCSGGGKSTLLAELSRRGHAIVQEPGRRIVQEELQANGSALPWRDGVAFARRLVDMALSDRLLAQTLSGWVFFDRGLIDAAVALQHLTGERALVTLGQSRRFNFRVVFAPPW